MAVTFQLIRNAATLNLASGVDAGWRATRWHPQVATLAGNRMPPLVTETVDFVVDEDTHNNLSTAFQNLDAYRWLAREYIQDRTQQYPVWWQVKMDAETGTRQALVYDLGLQWASEEADSAGQWICQSQALARATIVRGPFWERTSATSTASASGINILGGAFDYTVGGGADVVGDAPARINFLTIQSTPAGASYYSRLWSGFRSASKHGTLGNFVITWETEDATIVLGADTTTQTVAGATGGAPNCTRTTFATTATWSYRVMLRLSDFTSNYADNFGRFLVLCRAKVDSGTTAEIQLRSGIESDHPDRATVHSTVEVSSTAWAEHEIGLIELPFPSLQIFPTSNYAASYHQRSVLSIWARRTGGAGNLEIDHLKLIPADELLIKGESLQTNSGQRETIAASPKDEWQMLAYNTASSYFVTMGVLSHDGLGVPIGDGRYYVVLADDNFQNTSTDTYAATASLIPRWYNLRGSE